ncbi:ricin-type beta-trefoil lectin domain protein [Streptomyces sp. NPDC088752]|uniref:ricin-type beta-trefoil lectin domain protein n=1 Tax=Streptomyces sp. NPDC088752 TaxID=3154963 RepID=UPI00342A1870
MRFEPGLFSPRSRSSGTLAGALTTAVTTTAALAVLAGLGVRPGPALPDALPAAATGDSYDGYDAKAAQQLREDQCVGVDALRTGGPNMFALAQNALLLPPDQMHKQFERDLFNDKTPLHAARNADVTLTDEALEKVRKQGYAWSSAANLESYPNAPKDPGGIFDRTGLSPWLSQGYWASIDVVNPWYDSSPLADDKTKAAALAVGNPLYTSAGTPKEQEAWALWKKNSGKVEENNFFIPRVFADDARIFLASGGFPRTAPEPDTPEFRIAVEDLKARFSACGWHDPIDPNRVLGKQVAQAATEWQQEIAGQTAQRQQILTAGKDAAKALQDGTHALSMLLGQSWLADYYTRWQDHWSPGGVGWLGDDYTVIEVPGAKGMCLDVQGGGKTNGTPVQIYTCNGGAAQEWTLEGSEEDLHLRNTGSFKCLDVAGNASANGTKIQITDCYSTKGQSWKADVRAPSVLKSLTTGKCLDLSAFTKSTDLRLWDCKDTSAQKYLIKPTGKKGPGSTTQPAKAQFDAAKKGLTDAQAAAKTHLAAVKAQLEKVKKAAAASDTALQAAYGIADAAGAPRGRGLLVGRQKAQVTKGAVAALTALVKAGETAEAATRAAAADSATITQRAVAQTAQANAEFRKEAAYTAELQAKAAADGAKLHRDNAKKDKETAEAKLALALKAEGDAKAAAADAHAKRLAAEAEEAKAKAEKDTAAAKQSEAAQHKKNADAEAVKAEDARKAAEASEATAVARKNDAVKARDNAKAKRDDAWDAEQKADAARAKADAKEAYAQAHESDEQAKASREAADTASAHADDAEAAAGRARGEADAATRAASEADAAATRAEAAAKRSRANADAAQAAKLKADAAVWTATSAAADAIKASDHAAAEARTAVALADEAQRKAKEAKSHADAASKEAATARAASVKAAGFAYVTARAAAEAGAAASQVAKPANDAIQLGSPYAETDTAASLVVLTGQASKTIADQQKAVADAHAKNAQAEAVAAKSLADKATGDAKQAYVHAANAAGYAADARGYAKEALGYAAEAADAALKASQSLARTVEYDRRAAEDAAAADRAAGRAEGHARAARDSADQAALDAEGARQAASRAEQSAKDARAAADRAGTAAAEAEKAAEDALKYAQEAQAAAEAAERAQSNQQVSTGAGTGIGGTFYVVDEKSVTVTKADQKNDCVIEPGFTGCTVTFKVTFDVDVDFFLCLNPDVPATATGCPSSETLLLTTERFKGMTKEVTHYFSKWDLIQQTLTYQILKAVLLQDFVDCWHGSAGGCAWAASNFIPGKAFAKVAEAVRVLDAALNTGVGILDAYNALRKLDVDPATLARIENTVNLYEDMVTSCRLNSFPGTTRVLMADGSRKAISEVRRGDRVLAEDPDSGDRGPQTVTSTYAHDTDRLVDVSFADGQRLTSTAGHRVHIAGRGWVLVSELRAGDRLRSPDGALHAVGALRTRGGLVGQRVYDLTVDGPHTFYVRSEGARASDLLVHNCANLADELLFPDSEAHTLSRHVNPTPQQAVDFAKENERKGLAPISTVWTDRDIAQQAVERVLAEYFFPRGKKRGASFDALDNFLNKRGQWRNKDTFPIDGSWTEYASLGTVYHASGSSAAAGNKVRVVLKRLPGKSGHKGYIVFTSYPLP